MKIARQTKILEIIENNAIETQEELAVRLKEEGFDVTQATISRDIREMKLTKISMENGKKCGSRHFRQAYKSFQRCGYKG